MDKKWRYGLLLLLIGLILMISSIAMGAQTSFVGMGRGFDFMDKNHMPMRGHHYKNNIEKEEIDKFDDIEININNINLDFQISSDEKFHIGKSKEFNKNIDIINKDNKLILSNSKEENIKKLGTIIIFIPENYKFNNVNIKTYKSDTDIYYINSDKITMEFNSSNYDIDGNITSKTLEIASSNSYGEINSINSDITGIIFESTDMEIDNMDGKDIEIKNQGSDVEIEKITGSNINIENSGVINIENIKTDIFNSNNTGYFSVENLIANEKNIIGDIQLDF